jgi:hypothetical protein
MLVSFGVALLSLFLLYAPFGMKWWALEAGYDEFGWLPTGAATRGS